MDDSLIQIAKKIVADLHELLRAELALAQSELTTKFSRITMSAVSLIIGIILTIAGLPILLLGIAATIAIWLPVWASLLIVAAIVLLGGAIATTVGVNSISRASALPERTIANLQKDAAVIKEHI